MVVRQNGPAARTPRQMPSTPPEPARQIEPPARTPPSNLSNSVLCCAQWQCRASDLTVRLHRLCSGCAATLALPTPSCTGSPYPWHPRTIERWAGACAAAVDGLQNRTAGCATARHSHLTVSECESISLNALVNERSRCSHMALYTTLFSEARNVVMEL